jgi:hypothetical protein
MNKIKTIVKGTGKAIRLLLLLIVASVFSFAEGNSNEYNVKAMFVLNFMKYIEWPADASPNSMRIGVLGESEMFDALVNMTKNRQETKKITVEKIDENSTGNYGIIIIPKTQKKKFDEFLKRYQTKGVLVITDELKGAGVGAINLVTIENKIRFEINYSQAHYFGVRISSRLADLAITVYP